MIQHSEVCFTVKNEEKNGYVCRCITRAMIEMIGEKPLAQISISELTARAGVGRVSFYRNFGSREDVLRRESDRLLREWGRRFEEMPGASLEKMFPHLFDFFLENRAFYQAVWDAGLSHIVMESIVAVIGPREETDPATAFGKAFWAHGIFGWINEWVRRGMKEDGRMMGGMLGEWGKTVSAEHT